MGGLKNGWYLSAHRSFQYCSHTNDFHFKNICLKKCKLSAWFIKNIQGLDIVVTSIPIITNITDESWHILLKKKLSLDRLEKNKLNPTLKPRKQKQ